MMYSCVSVRQKEKGVCELTHTVHTGHFFAAKISCPKTTVRMISYGKLFLIFRVFFCKQIQISACYTHILPGSRLPGGLHIQIDFVKYI